MAQQTIGTGAAPNDGTGDTPRDAADKINGNFDELYAANAALPETIRDTIGTALVAGPGIKITVDDAGDTITVERDRAFIRLDADYTLTSTTAAQKTFNTTANGALTLETGVYRMRAMMMLTGMSATSGNTDFNLLGAGTATLAGQIMQTLGREAGANAAGGTSAGTLILGQNNLGADVVTAGTSTPLQLSVDGMFKCTSGGTIIPSLALTTAAAAVVKAGSFLEIERIADLGTNYAGAWA